MKKKVVKKWANKLARHTNVVLEIEHNDEERVWYEYQTIKKSKPLKTDTALKIYKSPYVRRFIVKEVSLYIIWRLPKDRLVEPYVQPTIYVDTVGGEPMAIYIERCE